MKRMKFISVLCVLVIVVGTFFQSGVPVNAATTTITFDTEAYEINNGDEIVISVYLNSDSDIGAYHAEVLYDIYRLQYVGGGDGQNDGKIILEGTGYGKDIVYKLTFKAVSGGKTKISCIGADIREEGDSDNKQQVSKKDTLNIVISGEDTAVAKENVQVYGIESDIPLCGVVDTDNGSRYYIVDHYRYVPDIATWDYDTVEDTYDNTSYTFLTNRQNSIRVLYLMDKDENFSMYAYSKENDALYPCQEIELSGEICYMMSVNVCRDWPDKLTLAHVRKENICYVLKQDGDSDFYKYDDGNLTLWSEDEGQEFLDGQMKMFYVILVIAFIVIVIIAVITVISTRRKHVVKDRSDDEKTDAEDLDYIEFIDVDSEGDNNVDDRKVVPAYETEESEREETEQEMKERPVIAVRNVTMKFKISTSDASGIKEYIIQKIKRKVTYREFLALDHVSFDVYKGEIVGVIGTNGSGKSTILRIVSGALNPTSGRVHVDRKKVQLLTLGTGFDAELTARENIYLNGAIIGYTKKFIDENFEKIVEFAELQDFVDEKVKNFSSGMVSRLGFAIATIGEAAEILILDEVLSVGDEFFRKKSLKRVKEMIHGGSTVLMVSHGMRTILENCTKVVWIEKGKLMMVGEPKEVCEAYQNHHK